VRRQALALSAFLSPSLLLLGSLAPPAALAAQGAGTLADPVVIDALPYALRSSTADSASSELDAYAPCAPGTDESGPEVVFELTLSEETRLTAWIEGDGGGVDIDVHILDDLSAAGAVAQTCLSRGNRVAEALLVPGTHYVVVDSYAGAAQAGEFVLRVDGVGPSWITRTLANGVTWRARRHVDPLFGAQLEHLLLVDTSLPGVRVEAADAAGCQTVSALGESLGAVAGINGGYFSFDGCPPVSLLKHDGALVGTNAVTRGAFGMSPAQEPLVALVPAGGDWPEAAEAHGGGPILVEGGMARSGNAAWATEGFQDAGFLGDNPRTFACADGEGHTALGTVDGRRASAKGMSLDELAEFAASNDVGCVEGVNLDGGGSTTMWIAGANPSGVVNYPSDGPDDETPLHSGERAVSGGLFVFAPPYNHPPRVQTKPSLDAAAGATYTYDCDAIDLDVDDALTFSLGFAPAGMSIDPVTGVVTWTPTASSPSSAEVTVVVSDSKGASTPQVFVLDVEGGQGEPIGGGAGGEGGGAGAGGMGTGGMGAGGMGVGAGCGCVLAGPRPARGHGGEVLAFGALVAALRRRGRLFRPRRDTASAKAQPA
jgi:hypothetical protein